MPLDAVLCDFDGVLRFHDVEVHARIERNHGLAPGTLLGTALSPALVGPAVTGEITCEEWEEALVAAFTGVLDSPERAARLVEEFVEVPAWIDERVRDLLALAQRHVPVVLVTNATTRLEEDLARLGLAHFADEVVSSARVGVAKPDRRIYEIAADRAGTAPERCLFVDDRQENVTAAETLGMTGVLFREAEDLRAALEAEGWVHSGSTTWS